MERLTRELRDIGESYLTRLLFELSGIAECKHVLERHDMRHSIENAWRFFDRGSEFGKDTSANMPPQIVAVAVSGR